MPVIARAQSLNERQKFKDGIGKKVPRMSGGKNEGNFPESFLEKAAKAQSNSCS